MAVKKNTHTCFARGQKWPPLEMNGKYAKNTDFVFVYSLQIIHNAEKESTAIKGWHSKISRVQNRPTPQNAFLCVQVWLWWN